MISFHLKKGEKVDDTWGAYKEVIAIPNMTAAELSRRTGIKVQTIYSILNKNQKRTNPGVYKLFAIALDVPEYIFESSNEENEKLLEEWFENEPLFKDNSQKKSVPSDTYLLDLMQEYHRSPEFILDGLKYISIYNRYATYDIKKLLQNAYHYDKGLFREKYFYQRFSNKSKYP